MLLGFQLGFSRWLVILSIFSCTCQSFGCLLWFSAHLKNHIGCLVLKLSYMSFIYFGYWPLFQHMVCNFFHFQFGKLIFFSLISLLFCRSFFVWTTSTCLPRFCLYFWCKIQNLISQYYASLYFLSIVDLLYTRNSFWCAIQWPVISDYTTSKIIIK